MGRVEPCDCSAAMLMFLLPRQRLVQVARVCGHFVVVQLNRVLCGVFLVSALV